MKTSLVFPCISHRTMSQTKSTLVHCRGETSTSGVNHKYFHHHPAVHHNLNPTDDPEGEFSSFYLKLSM